MDIPGTRKQPNHLFKWMDIWRCKFVFYVMIWFVIQLKQTIKHAFLGYKGGPLAVINGVITPINEVFVKRKRFCMCYGKYFILAPWGSDVFFQSWG